MELQNAKRCMTISGLAIMHFKKPNAIEGVVGSKNNNPTQYETQEVPREVTISKTHKFCKRGVLNKHISLC